MGRSFAASALLHLLLAALVVAVGTFGRELPPQEMPIAVEIVDEADLARPSPLPPKAPQAAAAPKPPQQAATAQRLVNGLGQRRCRRHADSARWRRAGSSAAPSAPGSP